MRLLYLFHFKMRADCGLQYQGGMEIKRDKMMAHEGYHEPVEELSNETRDMHRAIESLIEELEAVDWYNQRVDACKDKALQKILAHNRDEEKEHAAMVLEWIRQHDSQFEKELKEYLFTGKTDHK